MEGGPSQKFSSPEEEIAFLRAQIAERERALVGRNKEVDRSDVESLGKEVLRDYAEHEPGVILKKEHEISEHDLTATVEQATMSSDKASEILALAHEKGIRNALTALEKLGDAHLADEVHRHLVAQLRQGAQVADLKEGMPLFSVLNMTLFEVALPEQGEHGHESPLRAIAAAMEQFYAGMQTLGAGKKRQHYTLEVAVSDNRDDIIFYVGVPTPFVNLFEKQALSLFPSAVLTHQQNDYNIFVDGGSSSIAVAKQKKHPIYPIKVHTQFENDPLDVLLNAFSKIEREGGGAAIQLVIEAGGSGYQSTYERIIKKVRDGEKPAVAIRKSTISGELFEGVKDMVKSKPKEGELPQAPEIAHDALELFGEKVATPILNANIRIATSAKTKDRADQILTEVEAGFNQFENTQGNSLNFTRLRGAHAKKAMRAFSFREFLNRQSVPLSITELATLMHFPAEGVESSPQFKQSRAKSAPTPLDMPQHGTLLGDNVFRNHTTEIYITPADRLRHFYVIGQTGTGKTTLMKNMIVQDIRDGAGVCMIDPHGTDIDDVLSTIPDARIDDVIYFDPAYQGSVLGLNMLEFDPARPEQKTFVVNELFSIFQRLYGANPESMGPMFEQYFRNATLLVMEDPESGNTLMDISRVMADAEYRKMKLAKARNPVVTQFWSEIAAKAGGEAALENIVPYIVSKFDVFTANDFMRPIIGQQQSAFNFRSLMDERKILLVNLSKGRLGEINANLIGMILVGKILMAALSRVDDPSQNFPPFYLHIDEFQNVTTDSISAILSEARKYKLGLTIAHQYIAQIDEGIRDAVFGNVGSIGAFRVGSEDAQILAHQFEPVFDESDIMNIENHNAYLRILANGVPTKPFNIATRAPEPTNTERAAAIKQYSYQKHGKPLRQVEMEIHARYQKG